MTETDKKLRENIQAQLTRLTNQLADLEDMKDDLEPEEYEETKADTMKQLDEFQESLTKMTEGNLSLIDELTHLRMVIQAAVSAAFKTPEVIRLFAQKEPAQLRQHLHAVKQDYQLSKISVNEYRTRSVEILVALKQLGDTLTPQEEEMLNTYGKDSLSNFSKASDSVKESSVLSKAGAQVKSAQKK